MTKNNSAVLEEITELLEDRRFFLVRILREGGVEIDENLPVSRILESLENDIAFESLLPDGITLDDLPARTVNQLTILSEELLMEIYAILFG